VYAAFKFFLYTLLGSLLMLVALLYLYNKTGSFDILTWHKAKLSMNEQIAVLRLLHGLRREGADVAGAHLAAGRPRGSADRRLRRAGRDHAEAGRLRFPALLAADRAGRQPLPGGFIITLSLIAVIYIGLVALVQADMKKLVAYSSIAHMGFVTLGFFIFNDIGIEGGIVQMISHGFVSGAMFLCIGVLYDRVHSRQIADYGGVVNVMPKFAAFGVLRDGQLRPAGHLGLRRRVHGDPGRRQVQLLDRPAGPRLIFGAAYSLWMVKRVIFGDVVQRARARTGGPEQARILHARPAGDLTLYMGLYPKPFTDVMHASVVNLLSHVAQSKL
jgi:NADH-quinone oxidoreductase subunit M